MQLSAGGEALQRKRQTLRSGKHGVAKVRTLNLCPVEPRASQIGALKVAPDEDSVAKVRPFENGLRKAGVLEVGAR